MILNRGVILFNTLRYLKLKQIAYQIYYRVVKVKTPSAVSVSIRQWQDVWDEPAIKPALMVAENEFKLLGEYGRLVDSSSWNDSKKNKLWLYNLHYLDDLIACGAEKRFAAHVDLLKRWIIENPVMTGNGWEPYPISIRLVNIVKWFSRNSDNLSNPDQISFLISIGLQAQVLQQRIEYHILANHLFTNGKALVFAGAFLRGKLAEQCLQRGLSILDGEFKEQFLEDGAHFELSPMYHAVLLWDICDLVNLASCTQLPVMLKRVPFWNKILNKGLDWLRNMLHPDGDISFFNDAAFGYAPEYKEIVSYAERIGSYIEKNSQKNINTAKYHINWLKNSGYCRVSMTSDNVALLDLARIGADYQPGHAHADTLSFELSLYGQRVFVNSGTSKYGRGAERNYQRGTSAHNTVVINDTDSSEVWAGFRVARRAYPDEIDIKENGTTIIVSARHDGYMRLKSKNKHRRNWLFKGNSLVINDEITGLCNRAEAYFYLHPDIRVETNKFDECCCTLILSSGEIIRFRVNEGNKLKLHKSLWYPRFGVSVQNMCIVVTINEQRLTANIEWKCT